MNADFVDADEANRVRQGACATTSPDILRKLAGDPSVTVRASLALNPALPAQVVAMLAADTDARVRTILGRKLTTLAPTLTKEARLRVQQDAVANLTAMVAEAGQRVRASIAATIREMPDGPREIILRLAHDPVVMVCEPIILFSPMLTQEDLVALITSGPPSSTFVAVAKRPGIGALVSDAIVGTADQAAIGALLANHTAQIRETTLDALAAQSEEHVSWQEPLVRRPRLPARAQQMLSEIVTGHLLKTLAARDDLDPKVGLVLHTALARVEPNRPAAPLRQEVAKPAEADPRTALAAAQTLAQAGKLDDFAILDALRRNAMISATAMFAVKAGVAQSVVEHACGLRSAKAVVSLAWKAGLSAQTAVVLQGMLARLPPDQILRPRQDTGFPLTDDEMRWQLTFLGVEQAVKRPWMPRRLSAPDR
jgi:uncharacterized protein (DUF2336 family)